MVYQLLCFFISFKASLLQERPDRQSGSLGTGAGHRRRRASTDATANAGGGQNGSGINILKVFFSRAGHLIFAVVTTTSTCRCSSVQASIFNPFHQNPGEGSSTGSGNAMSLPGGYQQVRTVFKFHWIRSYRLAQLVIENMG